MKIKRTSISYKIAEFGGLCEEWNNSSSICSFHKHLLLGILQGIFGLAFGILVLTIMGSPFYYGILYLIDPVNTFPLTQKAGLKIAVGMGLDIVLIIIFVIFEYLKYKDKNYVYKEKIVKEPSQLALHWQSFRDKICIKVEYEE